MATRTPLSRERITDAALVLIDAEGLDALSMRKLGSALGVEAMSLYNHVRNKDDLLGAVTDRIYADILVRFEADTSTEATWQGRAGAMAHAYWLVARDHPRAFALVSQKPIDSMNGMMMLARCLEIFTDAGLSLGDAAAAFHAAAGWLLGTIDQEHGLMCKLVEGGGFTKADVPDALAAIVDFRDACLSTSPEARFSLGLEILIAGIEARLATASTRP
jgi:TetR/AcrR family transcriptional regulator, tetracycline repressor protein